MLGTVWGWVSAALGAAMLALLVSYGTASGVWLDEHGGLLVDEAGRGVDTPSVVPLLIAAGLAIVLLVGGIAVGVRCSRAGARASE